MYAITRSCAFMLKCHTWPQSSIDIKEYIYLYSLACQLQWSEVKVCCFYCCTYSRVSMDCIVSKTAWFRVRYYLHFFILLDPQFNFEFNSCLFLHSRNIPGCYYFDVDKRWDLWKEYFGYRMEWRHWLSIYNLEPKRQGNSVT